MCVCECVCVCVCVCIERIHIYIYTDWYQRTKMSLTRRAKAFTVINFNRTITDQKILEINKIKTIFQNNLYK